MAKRIALSAVLALLIAFLLSACASSGDEATSGGSSVSQPGGTVPGEKLPDEGSFAPGPAGSSGSVRW